MGRKLPPELSPEEDEYISKVLDFKQGFCIPIEDSLRYIFMHYVWKDQIPEDSRPDSGIPLLTSNLSMLEFGLLTPEERDESLEKVIGIYISRSKKEEVYWEALARLLFVYFEHDVKIPRILQTWAYSLVVGQERKFRQGPKLEINKRLQTYHAYQYLRLCKQCTHENACVIIENKTGILFSTIEDSIKETKKMKKKDSLMARPTQKR